MNETSLLPVWILGGVALLMATLLVNSLFERERLRTLRRIAGLLDDAVRVDDEAVAGMYDGWEVEVRRKRSTDPSRSAVAAM